MDKSWVLLPRTSLDYEEGATDFVYGSARRLGDPRNMFWPCIDCRNICHQPIATVLYHLVIRDMDQKYKRNRCWSNHGEIRDLKTGDDPTSEFKAYELFRAAFFEGDDNPQSQSDDADHHDDIESEEDSEFMEKLKDAETPLYSSCPKYTKVSPIMGLYRIKVKSGMSENYFDQLLKIVHDMNVMGDALFENIAWPISKLQLCKIQSTEEAVSKSESDSKEASLPNGAGASGSKGAGPSRSKGLG